MVTTASEVLSTRGAPVRSRILPRSAGWTTTRLFTVAAAAA
jgi:hypothetical protein